MEHNAAIIIIGNEILSGKTQDTNVQFIATELSKLGIALIEVRMIQDTIDDIVKTINELRAKYDYVFSTGGIGPTHDDITSESVAKAFGVDTELNKEALKIISDRCIAMGRELVEPTKKMAIIPIGAELIKNSETGAPGFKMDNVFVMAGIPYVMQAMFTEVKKFLSKNEHGQAFISKSIEIMVGESMIAEPFLALQNKFPEVSMGSYPFRKDGVWGTILDLRSKDNEKLEIAMVELEKMIEGIKK